MQPSASRLAEEFVSREFPMTQSDFDEIKQVAYSLTGIKLTDQKKTMVYGRLSRRLRALNLQRFSDYCVLIRNSNSPELLEFTNAITTNLTSFFREIHHFNYLKSVLIPELIEKHKRSQRIRLWSAGCSTGEEPYSIAMVLASFPELRNWDVRVLATDLDSNVVAKGKAGVYQNNDRVGIPAEYEPSVVYSLDKKTLSIKDRVANLITFKQLNLLKEWPMKGPFDAVFCRNVVIYFDEKTQRTLFDRYANILSDDAHLFIGHSESLNTITDRFLLVGQTIYKKIS